ncbi:MAG: hypothetical protein IJT37_05760 [Lachnospiraceae bacterium]|nr:hypothetical protein [Lachnospiraceae bacterium]
MSKRTTAKQAWRKKKYWKSEYATKKEREMIVQPEKQDYVKVRMQSTPEEIDNFRRMLEMCQEMGMCEVMNFSELFPNRDTNRYYRAYSDVLVKEGVDHE